MNLEEVRQILITAGFTSCGDDKDSIGFDVEPIDEFFDYPKVAFYWTNPPCPELYSTEVEIIQWERTCREVVNGYKLALEAAGLKDLETEFLQDSGGGVWVVRLPVPT